MTNKPKALGTAAESAVVAAFQRSGWPSAERRALRGIYDAGDLTGVPGLVVEVKGGQAAKTASDLLIEAWLAETTVERENANANHGILVVQRKAVGYPNADRWWAYMEACEFARLMSGFDCGVDSVAPVRLLLRDLFPILRASGYGDPIEVAS